MTDKFILWPIPGKTKSQKQLDILDFIFLWMKEPKQTKWLKKLGLIFKYDYEEDMMGIYERKILVQAKSDHGYSLCIRYNDDDPHNIRISYGKAYIAWKHGWGLYQDYSIFDPLLFDIIKEKLSKISPKRFIIYRFIIMTAIISVLGAIATMIL